MSNAFAFWFIKHKRWFVGYLHTYPPSLITVRLNASVWAPGSAARVLKSEILCQAQNPFAVPPERAVRSDVAVERDALNSEFAA